MKIIKYTKVNKKYQLTLDNNEKLLLYDDVILNNNLLLEKEIKDIDKLIKDNTYYEAYDNALKYIEKKLRTKKELKDYLDKKYESDIVSDALNKIEKSGYLNDKQYISAYINDQINLTNNGYYKILRDLKNKDLDESLIKDYLNDIDDSIWIDKVNKIIDKKVKTNTKYSSNYLKEKILSDLNNLGYESSMIIDLVNNYKIEEPDDALEKNYNILYNKLSKKYSGKELYVQLLNKLLAKGFKYDDVKRKLNDLN